VAGGISQLDLIAELAPGGAELLRRHLPPCSQLENNYFTETCSGSEAGSYARCMDCAYHSTLGLRVINQKKEKEEEEEEEEEED